MHIERYGNVYLLFYLQIGDRYYNTDLVDIRPQAVNNRTSIQKNTKTFTCHENNGVFL